MEYKKISQEINNVVSDNVNVLAQLFPSAVKDGQVDFTALKEELGQFEEVGKEKYELTWSGKQNAKKLAQEDIYNRTLKYIEKDSKNPEMTENLYIEGDNLEVLKLLRQNYYGAIKMIYIDPPYNTGEDFLYNDKRILNRKESDIAEGVRDGDGNLMIKNQKSSNMFHAKWLNDIYPKLKLSKDLLTEDGVLFISIDDNEINNLLTVVNEIFGEGNVKPICVKMSEASGLKMGAVKKTGSIPKLKEYIIIIRQNGVKNFSFDKIQKGNWDTEYNIYLENFTKQHKELLDSFIDTQEINETNIAKLNEIASEIKLVSLASKLKEMQISEENKLEWLYNNAYRICQCATSASVLKLAEENKKHCKLENFFVASNNNENIYFVRGNYSTSSKKPRVQLIFAEDNLSQHPGDIWLDIKTTGLDNEGNIPFKNGKKPIKLLDRLINSVGKNETTPFYILDFFSGSASTAEAVIRNNYTNNKSNNFILVQLQENLDENYNKATGDSKKSIKSSLDFLEEIQKPHFVTELGKERIRRVGEKVKEEIETANAQLKLGEKPKQMPDIGFKVFRTDDTNIKWNLSNTTGQMELNDAVFSPDTIDFVMGTNDIDVVYEVMLRQKDIALSESLKVLTDIGDRTYLYASSYLVCLETEITEEMIEKISTLEPLPIKFVFRDSAFGDDIDFKDYTFRKLGTLIEINSGLTKKTYTVEFI